MGDPLERTFLLSERQRRIVAGWIGRDSDGNLFIELPEHPGPDCRGVKVLDSDGVQVGEIDIWQAFSINKGKGG